MKQCTKCKKWMNESQFHKYKNSLRSNCKKCISIYNKKYSKIHKEEITKYKKLHPWGTRVERNKYLQEWREKLSPEKKEFYNRHRREYIRTWRKQLSPEKKLEILKKHEEYYKQYRNTPNGKIKRNISNTKWRKTIAGKDADSKMHAKRKRNLKWIELFTNPFPKGVDIAYHHINNLLVIPLPIALHQSIGGNNPNHRMICNKWIEYIYCLNINSIFKEDAKL